jgi:site-specific DNA-methyltransferase (adenine-specific)
MAQGNVLYHGDNLSVLRRRIPAESVDLIYLDPPFNSNATYDVRLDRAEGGSVAAGRTKAFDDTWRWDQGAAAAFQEVVDGGGDAARAMTAFKQLLGTGAMLAYLAMIAPRLVELRSVLKRSGSIYLHCDPTAAAQLRLLMDAIFGTRNFVNEIVWSYRTGGISKRWFARKHDVILFYARSTEYIFALPKEKSYLAHRYGFKNVDVKEDERGFYTEVGMRDVWEVPALRGNQPEYLGYPTQKPVAILERMIAASTKPGDVVLDPFCGCGTALAAAEKLDRNWIGIDLADLAVDLITARLTAMGSSSYEVVWCPSIVGSAV